MNQKGENIETCLSVQGLSVDYGRGSRRRRVLDGVSFDVGVGETVGLVGESGSGKTTIARSVVGLTPASEGSIHLGGLELAAMRRRSRRAVAREVQYVFQDPYASLNPTRTVRQTLEEALYSRPEFSGRDRAARIDDVLLRVGIEPGMKERYPGSFSGGQRQRIAIARAMLPRPRLIVCDEPTASLDLSIQAQILELFIGLQEETGVSYLFIAHNLDVVRAVSHRTIVLRHGRIVESGSTEKIATAPEDAYTSALLAATPVADPEEQARRRSARQAGAFESRQRKERM